MKPAFIPHLSYQQFLLDDFRRYYGPTFVIINKDWPLVTKFWMTDLSALTTLLRDLYSNRGPEPRDPASMFRSLLLLIMTNPTMGTTEWVNEMQRTPLYAILSGFDVGDVGDVPGVGTFYDFFKRLWASYDKHLRAQKRKRRKAKTQEREEGGESTYRNTWTYLSSGGLDDAAYGQKNRTAYRQVI